MTINKFINNKTMRVKDIVKNQTTVNKIMIKISKIS